MTYTIRRSQIRTLKSNDSRFHITDGLAVAPRAGFEISSGCPYSYRQVIQECVNNGWLQPVAYMTERELVISGLARE